jgi:hypothetical protein
MSKIKSALGDVVDFEMMRIMEEFGTTNVSTQPNIKVNTTVDPSALVIDNIPSQVSIISRPEYISTTVPVTEPVIEQATEPQITIAQPETVNKTVKPTKKGDI